MPLDPSARRFLDLIAPGEEQAADWSAEGRRRGLANLTRLFGGRPEPAAEVTDGVMDGPGGCIPYRLYRPLAPSRTPPPIVVFLHGGGWVAGDLETHDGLCRALCASSGCAVAAIDYRRPPEHRFPAAVEDAVAAVRGIASRAEGLGLDASRLAVAGDSAGGGLAAAACALIRDAGGPWVALQALICPILDARPDSPSHAAFGEGHFLERSTFQADLAAYAPGADLDDPRLSPGRAPDLAGLPPALVHVAEFDPFRDEGLAYAARLAAAGVPARATTHPGLIHFFYALPRAMPLAPAAVQAIGREIGEALAG